MTLWATLPGGVSMPLACSPEAALEALSALGLPCTLRSDTRVIPFPQYVPIVNRSGQLIGHERMP